MFLNYSILTVKNIKNGTNYRLEHNHKYIIYK
jgi:hypothetical protein